MINLQLIDTLQISRRVMLLPSSATGGNMAAQFVDDSELKAPSTGPV